MLTADEQPVMFNNADSTNPRPWLLRENCVYDITHDIEGGWEVCAHDDAEATDPARGRHGERRAGTG